MQGKGGGGGAQPGGKMLVVVQVVQEQLVNGATIHLISGVPVGSPSQITVRSRWSWNQPNGGAAGSGGSNGAGGKVLAGGAGRNWSQ